MFTYTKTSEWCLKNAEELTKLFDGIIKLHDSTTLLGKECSSVKSEQRVENTKVEYDVPMQVDTLNDVIMQTTKYNRVQSSSQNLGVQGEMRVFNALSKEFNIENTTQKDKSGDFQVNFHGRLYLIEIKNYTANVPYNQITKLHNDISGTNAHGALFISLNSKIVGMSTDVSFRLESINGRMIPCIYLCTKHDPSPETSWINFFRMLTQICVAYSDIHSQIEAVKGVEAELPRMREHAEILSRARQRYSENIMMINRILYETHESIVIADNGIKTFINSIIPREHLPVNANLDALCSLNEYKIVLSKIRCNSWKITKKLAISDNGYGFQYLKIPQFMVEKSKLSDIDLIGLIRNPEVTLDDKYVYINITKETVDIINNIIKN